MSDRTKPEDKKTAVSLERRDFLKAGVVMAAAPFLAGMGSAVLPSEALAAAGGKSGRKVLVISASPRENSNSEALCDEFMRGALESGHEVEKIRLADKKINYCTGCLACVSDPGECSQDDDMTGIYQKMIAADIIVLGTPVYFHVMNGQMKVFIDRVCPVYTMIRNKDFYYAVSCAGGDAQVESSVNSLKIFTRSFSGAREKGIMSVTGAWEGGAAQWSPSFKEAYTMGLNS
ncbi:NAD(P)H-dependent oxidoreductase [Maridesulfovibrio sp.]|uniref:flavodoxin family protein n=1 Tax=Maridesulfovibrio sp. TaxID=2795000 RepID=UPI002A18AE62|nr:NAD(P)H-dependent oxidoreductase [Maridesulfovibrio sp.]